MINKFFKRSVCGIFILIITVIIFFVGFLIIVGNKRSDQSAIIKLNETYYLNAELKLKDFPGQALVLWIYDKDGSYVDSQNIEHCIEEFPIDYVENRNSSWKEVELIEDYGDIKVYSAIWGKVFLDCEEENVTIEWADN